MEGAVKGADVSEYGIQKEFYMSSNEERQLRDDRLSELARYCQQSGVMDLNLYQEYDVKRGLRDSDGKGVLTGLTEISDVNGYKVKDGRKVPVDGELFFQGYNINDIVSGFKFRIVTV